MHPRPQLFGDLILRLTAGLLLTAVLLPLAGCSTNPATGRWQLNSLSEADEIKIGSQAQPDFIANNGGEVPSPRLVRYVTELGQRMAQVSERPQLPWEFHVLNTDQLNAFALPGGKVFMTRGLLSRMTNESQLAGVLGHEIGHVTAEHVGQRMTRGRAVEGLAVLVGAAGVVSDVDWVKILGAGVGTGGGVYLLKFGRDQESQSDELGVRYMTRVGYDPRGQIEVMQILKEAAGGGQGSELLATHPLPETRIRRLTDHIGEHYADDIRTGGLKVGVEDFRRNVLDELAKLGPAAAGAGAMPGAMPCSCHVTTSLNAAGGGRALGAVVRVASGF